MTGSAAAAAPPKQRVSWARVELEPGESKSIEITVDPHSTERSLSFWSSGSDAWQIADGEYQVYVGASSRDIRLTGAFRIRGLENANQRR
jgi:beta-glucosidase